MRGRFGGGGAGQDLGREHGHGANARAAQGDDAQAAGMLDAGRGGLVVEGEGGLAVGVGIDEPVAVPLREQLARP